MTATKDHFGIGDRYREHLGSLRAEIQRLEGARNLLKQQASLWATPQAKVLRQRLDELRKSVTDEAVARTDGDPFRTGVLTGMARILDLLAPRTEPEVTEELGRLETQIARLKQRLERVDPGPKPRRTTR